MDTDQAKSIHLCDLLASLGYDPQKETKGERWYLSPFRIEKEPSFKVTRSGRGWYDHGEGKGGNILDFVMHYKGADLRGALRFLDGLTFVSAYPVGNAVSRNGSEARSEGHIEPKEVKADICGYEAEKGEFDGLSAVKLQSLNNWALNHYLQSRGIDQNAAQPWVQEIHYRRHENPYIEYFALAFANDSGGYELRNQHFQGGIGRKDITTIGVGEGDATKVVLFEGFTDFLSAIMLTGRSPSLPVVVLNSVAMQHKALQTIQKMGVTDVHLYRDRDDAGLRLIENFRAQLPALNIIDESNLYREYKDLNEYLVAKNRAVTLAI